MRLTTEQINIIKTHTKEIFGMHTKTYLFGSRTNDELKGGDIDLYIIPEHKNTLLENRLKLAAILQQQLGEQKIDIIIATDPNRPIEQQALATGILL